MRIPLPALDDAKPLVGTHWRLNLYRSDRANQAALAWSPGLEGNFHAPNRFGRLEIRD